MKFKFELSGVGPILPTWEMAESELERLEARLRAPPCGMWSQSGCLASIGTHAHAHISVCQLDSAVVVEQRVPRRSADSTVLGFEETHTNKTSETKIDSSLKQLKAEEACEIVDETMCHPEQHEVP